MLNALRQSVAVPSAHDRRTRPGKRSAAQNEPLHARDTLPIAALRDAYDGLDGVGSSIGRYRLDRLLGEGGMGRVYLATDRESGERSAIKVLHATCARDRQMVRRFVAEAEAARSIQHANVVKVCGLVTSGPVYYVMEWVDGQTLAAQLERGPLPLPEALSIALQVCDALRAAHAAGVVHRDLKPENVLLADVPNGSRKHAVKITDFGIAKTCDALRDLTPSGLILGTPAYMAPEQALPGDDVDHRADIYSFGVLLYEMLSGEPPFAGNVASLIRSQIEESPVPLRFRRDLPQHVPAVLDRLIARCMHKRKSRRPPNMAEVSEQLSQIISSLESRPTRVERRSRSFASGRVRRIAHAGLCRLSSVRWTRMALVGALLLSLLGAAYAAGFRAGARGMAVAHEVARPGERASQASREPRASHIPAAPAAPAAPDALVAATRSVSPSAARREGSSESEAQEERRSLAPLGDGQETEAGHFEDRPAGRAL